MTDVLVLVEHANGELKNTTAELLTAAAAFGTPTAVVVGAPGAAASYAETLAAYGAGEILAAESADADKYLITPEVDVLVGLAAERQVPVLVAASATGKEIAGRRGRADWLWPALRRHRYQRRPLREVLHLRWRVHC